MEQKEHLKKDLLVSQENQVTISVWLTSIPTRIGHVSLETYGNNGIYASYWPSNNRSQPVKFWGQPSSKPQLKRTYLNDINDEGGSPDIIVSLYSLDVNEINKAYEAFIKKDYNWNIFGSYVFSDKIQNCSGLVALLLSKGGIEKLTPSNDSTNATDPTATNIGMAPGLFLHNHVLTIIGGYIASVAYNGKTSKGSGIFITPNGIANIAILARKQELDKYNLIPSERYHLEGATIKHIGKKIACTIL